MAKFKSIQTKRPLPNKLSDLLDMAVEDARKARAAGHKLDMGTWYERKGQKCTVCLAGAVMLCELAPEAETLEPFDFDMPEQSRLLAIDYMRTGDLPESTPDGCQPGEVVREVFYALVDYDKARAGRVPWAHYTRAAEYLRSQGY